MTQTMNVEYQELMARADEIEAPLPALPIGNPQAPCGLSFVRDAAVQIAINADSLRLYIQACQREWKSLAKSLRNAAKAYEEVDEEAAEDINAINMDGTSGVSAKMVSGDDKMSLMCDPDYIPAPLPPPPPPPPFEYPYYEVRQAATDIESPDQGTAFRACASDWNRYQLQFQQLAYRFRPFLNWEGDARTAVESNFNSQKQWIFGMVTLCTALAKQAQMVAEAHKRVRASGNIYAGEYYGLEGEHPATYEVQQCDYWYKFYVQNKSPYLYSAIDWYKKLQTRSETALSTYISAAGIPLPPLNPTAPYGAYVISPPSTDADPNNPDLPDTPGIPSDPSANMPMMPMMPTMPSAGMGGGTPATPDAQGMVDDAMKKAGLSGKSLGGVKPASFGGGGGVPGLPGTPLQGLGDGEAASRPAAAAPGGATAGMGKGLPGAGAGGGMGGGMPMGGAGGGKSDGGKGKRVQSADGDESLYTEERAWTEGVIGNRPRKGPGEKSPPHMTGGDR
jgi:uncharacterized protein YukE